MVNGVMTSMYRWGLGGPPRGTRRRATIGRPRERSLDDQPGAALTRRITGRPTAEADDAVAGGILGESVAILPHRPAEEGAETQAVDMVVRDTMAHRARSSASQASSGPSTTNERRRRQRRSRPSGSTSSNGIGLPARPELWIASGAFLRGQPVPVAVVDLEQPGGSTRFARDRRPGPRRWPPRSARHRRAGLLSRRSSSCGSSSSSAASVVREAAGELDARGGERQVAALAEIAPGGGCGGDRVTNEDQAAHRRSESTGIGALSCRGRLRKPGR